MFGTTQAQRKHIPCRNHFAFANCRAGSRCPYSHTSEAAALYDAVGHALWEGELDTDPIPTAMQAPSRTDQPHTRTAQRPAPSWDRSAGVLDVLQMLGSVGAHLHPSLQVHHRHHHRRPVRRERETEPTYDQLSSICEELGDVDVPAKDWKRFLLTRKEERKLQAGAGEWSTAGARTCPICLDDCLECSDGADLETLESRPSVEILAAPERRTLLLSCRHMMHKNCGEEYFRRKHVCPVCRVDVNDPLAKKPTI